MKFKVFFSINLLNLMLECWRCKQSFVFRDFLITCFTDLFKLQKILKMQNKLAEIAKMCLNIRPNCKMWNGL